MTLKFVPFEKVLAKNSIHSRWYAAEYSHEVTINKFFKHCLTTGKTVEFCIPYKGNEEYLGTYAQYNK